MSSQEYREYPELKALIKCSGLTIKEVAFQLGEIPTNLSSRINGYTKLSPEMYRQIERICEESAVHQ